MARRLMMDLESGTRFRLFRSDWLYEVAGFRIGEQYLLNDHPRARILIRQAGSFDMPTGFGETHRSVERWVLRELDRGGWPWPT
jgi:hypothetical protein